MSANLHPKGVTRQKVLDILRREADLDGLVLIAETEVAAELGISQVSAGQHIRNLASHGLLSITPNAAGWHNSINAIQLAESVMA